MKLNDNDDLKSVDDDLTPVDDNTESVPDNQNDLVRSHDGFLLEQGGEKGLTFEPKENAGIYALSSGDTAESDDDDQYQSSSQSDAPRLDSNVSSDDVYGIVPPDPVPDLRPESTRAEVEESQTKKKDRDKKRKESRKRSFFSKKQTEESFPPPPDDDISIETLKARRQRAILEEELEKSKAERTPLPARPFWDDLVKPFFSPGCAARLLMVAGAAFIPLLMATFFFSTALSRQIVADSQHSDVSSLVAFFRCLWEDRVVFMLFCFLWGIFSVPISFQIFIDTASGADEIDEWPDYSFLGGLMDFLWIAALIVLAGIPGAALFSFLGFNYLVGLTLSSTLLTPIFYLSCMQSDARFTLITKEVLVSIKTKWHCWLIFTGISFAFLFGTIAISLAAISSSVVTEEGAKISFIHAAVVAAVLSLVFSFIPALYLRFLGRLAWIVEDDARKRAELKLQEEEAQYYDEPEQRL